MDGPRALRPDELGSLADLLNRVFRPGGGDMGAEFRHFLIPENCSRLRACLEDGAVVAHSGYRLYQASAFGARLSIGCLGAVATDPEQRGKGLATQLFLDCVEAMRAEGADLAMISGARGLYTRNAAVAFGRDNTFRVTAGPCPDADVEAAPAVAGEASVLASIARAEPVRFLRPPSEWADILAGRTCMNRPARLWSIRRGGRLVAYAATRTPKDHDEGELADCMLLGEYAGCRRSLAAVLPHLVDLAGLEAVRVQVRPWDRALEAEFEARAFASHPTQRRGTAKLVNFAQLFDRLRDLMIERAGPRAGELQAAESDGRYIFSLGAERLELGEEDACRITFGTSDRSERELLEGRGELGRVLGAALPAQLPWYGYSYV